MSTTKKCRFCGKTQKKPLSCGYCISCYQYFVLHGFDTWWPSQYGSLSRVQKQDHIQYQMPICHICGKAFEKLQQHIWYAHNMTKKEYCDRFGIDRKINMTTPRYNKKMHDYALENNMDEQLRIVGKETRFEKGHQRTYERSEQTKRRLTAQGKLIAKEYGWKGSNSHDTNRGVQNKSKK